MECVSVENAVRHWFLGSETQKRINEESGLCGAGGAVSGGTKHLGPVVFESGVLWGEVMEGMG
jgi:hypothetical protein